MSRALDFLPPDTVVQGWSADSRAIYALQRTGTPAAVHRVDLASGASELWLTLAPPDRAGVAAVQEIVLTPDGTHYAYSFFRRLSDLYLVTGLH